MEKEAAASRVVAGAGGAVTAEENGAWAVKWEGSWLLAAGEAASKQLRVADRKKRAAKIERR